MVRGFLSHKMAEINRIIGRAVAPFLQGWSSPNYQGFDWGVAAFAVGIAVYFALPFEPNIFVLTIIFAVVGISLLAANRFAFRLYPYVFIVFLTLLGMGRSA